MKEPTSVGLGEQAISRNPEDILVAYGLGSCVGVIMIDPVSKVSGLLHAVLPKATDGFKDSSYKPSKFVESGIEQLLADLIHKGAMKSRLIVHLVGGANMLMLSGVGSFDIGNRNLEAAYAVLNRLNMQVTSADVGGHLGRTVRIYVADGRVTIRSAGQKEHSI